MLNIEASIQIVQSQNRKLFQNLRDQFFKTLTAIGGKGVTCCSVQFEGVGTLKDELRNGGYTV